MAQPVSGLIRAILAEMLGLSAGALGGIQLVLAGPSAAIQTGQPAGVSEGLRQAADRLSSGFGEMAGAFQVRPVLYAYVFRGPALPVLNPN